MSTLIKFITDSSLDTLKIVGSGHSHPSASYGNNHSYGNSGQPSEVIQLQSFSVSFSFSASYTDLTVTRTGYGAGQGSPVIINLG